MADIDDFFAKKDKMKGKKKFAEINIDVLAQNLVKNEKKEDKAEKKASGLLAREADRDKEMVQSLQGDENVTNQSLGIINSAENELKHPLKTTWTLWIGRVYKNDKNLDLKTNQIEIASFDTVEDFWALMNHVIQPSKLEFECNYSLFRKGIKPNWEDQANVSGGRWLYEIHNKKYGNEGEKLKRLDRAWLEIMMCLVGEAFGEIGSYVNGAVCQRRNKKLNKVALWVSTSSVDDESIIYPIGTIVKQRCGPDIPLFYEDHYSCLMRMPFTHRFQIE